MNEQRYTVPGWMAITAAALTLPMVVLGIILDVMARRSPETAAAFLLPYLAIAVTQAFCGLYALARLKTLLNRRHAFHDVDGLILAIIIGASVITLIALAGRVTLVLLGADARVALFFVPLIFVCGVGLSVLGIIFALKLLRLGSDLGGLLKPFAYTTIAASICFATLILAPVGLLLDAATNVMLGFIFLRPESANTPDFV